MAVRNINIDENLDALNPWVKKSIELFNDGQYLDKISRVYNYQAATPVRIQDNLRRQIRVAHNNRNDEELIRLLSQLDKFPYDEPFWYLLKNVPGFIENNPEQVRRIARTLYSMTDEEVVVRIESQPKLNQQTGPMFNNWLREDFEVKSLDEFKDSREGIVILGESEEVGRNFLVSDLNQNVSKRPDLIAKVNTRYVIGEAKWIGQSGGNQYKSVAEVLKFCGEQRGQVLRIGIIDGYPWMTKKSSGAVVNDRICVEVQESTYNSMSALLLNEFFTALMN
jgi:hypothetical protein